MCRVGHLDPSGHRTVLMRTGFILLIVGHLIFITAALVHGTALRFVLTALDATSLHYGVTNSASVIAALLTISCGVCALLLSRYLGPAALRCLSSPLPPAEMGSAGPELLQQPGLPVLPAGAARGHRPDPGHPGPGAAGPLLHRQHRPGPSVPRVPLRPHPRLQLHAVPLGHLAPAGGHGDLLQHPLPPAHPRAPEPRPLLPRDAPDEGLPAGSPCAEPWPWAVPGLAETGQWRNCPALRDKPPCGCVLALPAPFQHQHSPTTGLSCLPG
ncbi:transmembrane protein 54 isoform X1 [Haemorhous mexicanus]|uniref:transmembrane protein 54 isoform X1 n=1 Tax=Haemorhous mexicanus TaxID=30427 RepID=UPI0028BED62E|nr:transmembrane protein 54 isoform X1 [Haemorhous mexicanus]